MTQLQPPGSGLPPFERMYLNAAFKIGTALMSEQRALSLFLRESETIMELVDEGDLDHVTEQVMISRMQGIEDSSRNWSLLMVMEHLVMVNQSILHVIGDLKAGLTVAMDVKIADYKPNPQVGLPIIDRFHNICSQYQQAIESHGRLRGTGTVAHPWFGPLNAHGWHCLAAVHMRIHRRQARKISAMLGVA